MTATISIVFDRLPGEPYYQETLDAVQHAIDAAGADIAIDVRSTESIDDTLIGGLSGGVVIGPGTPFSHPQAAEDVITSARARGIPLVGT